MEQGMKFWLVQLIRNRDAKHLSSHTFWWYFYQPERAVIARNDPHIQFPCHLSYFKCIVGSDGTNCWVVPGRYKWWVFSAILKMVFGFRRSWMRRKQRSPPLVSYRINKHIIHLDGVTPTPNVAKCGVLVQPRLIDVFADFIWNCLVGQQLQPETFRNILGGVPPSKLMICVLIIIETSGGSLCFLPIQDRRKLKFIFRISENNHHLYRPGTTQKFVPSEPTIHLKVAWMTWKWDLWVVLGKHCTFGWRWIQPKDLVTPCFATRFLNRSPSIISCPVVELSDSRWS